MPDGSKFGACQYCGFCERFGCESNAKGSPHITVIPAALKNPNVELRTYSWVTKVLKDSDGKKATGVLYVNMQTGEEIEQPADVVAQMAATIVGDAAHGPPLRQRVSRRKRFGPQAGELLIRAIDQGLKRLEERHTEIVAEVDERFAFACIAPKPAAEFAIIFVEPRFVRSHEVVQGEAGAEAESGGRQTKCKAPPRRKMAYRGNGRRQTLADEQTNQRPPELLQPLAVAVGIATEQAGEEAETERRKGHDNQTATTAAPTGRAADDRQKQLPGRAAVIAAQRISQSFARVRLQHPSEPRNRLGERRRKPGLPMPLHFRTVDIELISQSDEVNGRKDAEHRKIKGDPRPQRRAIAAAQRFVDDRQADAAIATRYIPPQLTGYEELDQYGSWTTTTDYGPVWTPRVVAVDWAPYRDGRWVWVNPWGWTWVDDMPWGFAPFHYGRWAYWGNRWCWVPGPYEPRPAYAPAVVGWVGGAGFSLNVWSGGRRPPPPRYGAWVPLAPREAYYQPGRYSNDYWRRVNPRIEPGRVPRPNDPVPQFRYAVIYNSTAASGNLIAWYDYGAEINMNSGDTFGITFDAVNGLLQLT